MGRRAVGSSRAPSPLRGLGSPARRAKLSEAYEVAGGDHEKAARIRGVTPGSAPHAKKRYLDISPGFEDIS